MLMQAALKFNFQISTKIVSRTNFSLCIATTFGIVNLVLHFCLQCFLLAMSILELHEYIFLGYSSYVGSDRHYPVLKSVMVVDYFFFSDLISVLATLFLAILDTRSYQTPHYRIQLQTWRVVSRARPFTQSLRWERVWSNSHSKLVLHCQHNCIHCGQLVGRCGLTVFCAQ